MCRTSHWRNCGNRLYKGKEFPISRSALLAWLKALNAQLMLWFFGHSFLKCALMSFLYILTCKYHYLCSLQSFWASLHKTSWEYKGSSNCRLVFRKMLYICISCVGHVYIFHASAHKGPHLHRKLRLQMHKQDKWRKSPIVVLKVINDK